MSWITRLFASKSAEFPNDVNGDVFRRMRDHGDDLAKPREIDFNHLFQQEEDAAQFIAAVREKGYAKADYKYADELKAWDAQVQIFMLPTHAGVSEKEAELDAIARTFRGRADGWGCMQVDKS